MSFYEPLDVENYEIRLLTILPGPSESIVKCTITNTSLINPIQYTALSYCWGDSDITIDIVVNNMQTPVPVNLAKALQQLRENRVRLLWVDALCINQADRQEKNHQIKIMRHIYERAENTCAWIGREGHDGAADAVSFLQSLVHVWEGNVLADVRHTHMLPLAGTWTRSETNSCQRCLMESRFQSLSDFFRREYWKRRWIIQELAVASRAQVWCGKLSITLEGLETALGRCRTSCYWVESQFTDCEYFNQIAAFRSSYKRRDKISLCRAIASTGQSLSKDPRDRIYALLGLCSDGPELVPIPSYQQPVEVVIMNLTRALIWQRCSLDIILTKQHSDQPATALPSWAIDWLQVESISPKALEHAEQQFDLDRVFLPQPAVVDVNILRAQGVIIGEIVEMARIVASEEGLRFTPMEGSSHLRSSTTSIGPYYDDMADLLKGILACMVPKQTVEAISGTDVALAWVLLIRHGMEASQDRPGISRAVYRRRKQRLLVKRNTSCLEAGPRAPIFVRQVIHHCIQAKGNLPVQPKTLTKWLSQNSMQVQGVAIFGRFCGYPLMFVLLFCALLPGGALLVASEIIATREYHTGNPVAPLNSSAFQESARAAFMLFLFSIMLTLFGLIFWTLGLLSCLLGKRRRLKWMQGELRSGLESQLDSKLRPILSDTGFIGSVDAQAEVGDKICLIIGCTSPIVLREVRNENKVQYTVIGTAFIHLSGRHQQEHQELMNSNKTLRDQELLQTNRRSGKYREFELI